MMLDIILYSLIAVFIISVSYLLYSVFRNPFKYPYFSHSFNVSGKRNVDIENYIDMYIIDYNNWKLIESHENYIRKWKSNCNTDIQKSHIKNYRQKQYLRVLDDENAFIFLTVRNQTRYIQRNYSKTSYKIPVTDSTLNVSYAWLYDRYLQLEQIGFETTLNNYNSKSQRKLMTSKLRKEIMERDNYTCVSCGKYMPDEVGLHIDHIVPVSKGGKSIPSNLCVLCSKCNGRKGAKLN